jgi:hypothetical protein
MSNRPFYSIGLGWFVPLNDHEAKGPYKTPGEALVVFEQINGLGTYVISATSAADYCQRAASLVAGERDRQHGAKERNFANIAGHWTWWLRARGLLAADAELTPVDVAQMMAGLKQARTLTGAHNPDDAVDHIGYAACAGELAARCDKG